MGKRTDRREVTTVKTPAKKTRKHTRFPPDPGTIAAIRGRFQDKTLSLVGLVVEEAYGGCRIAVAKHAFFKKLAKFEIKVGKLRSINAEARWVKSIDDDLLYVGVMYTD